MLEEAFTGEPNLHQMILPLTVSSDSEPMGFAEETQEEGGQAKEQR